jgi:hypothetical protein
MFTRQDYMQNKCTHEQYYRQFVNDNVILMLKDSIGIDRIKKAKDKHFNDIPLYKWDNIGLSCDVVDLLKQAGDYYTLAGQVCILKAGARKIRGY